MSETDRCSLFYLHSIEKWSAELWEKIKEENLHFMVYYLKNFVWADAQNRKQWTENTMPACHLKIEFLGKIYTPNVRNGIKMEYIRAFFRTRYQTESH